MFQWKETETTKKRNDETVTEYTYSQGWFDTRIDSSTFQEGGHDNPGNAWPFETVTQSAQNVTMGKFRLNSGQVAKLGQRDEDYEWEDEGENAIAMTADALS